MDCSTLHTRILPKYQGARRTVAALRIPTATREHDGLGRVTRDSVVLALALAVLRLPNCLLGRMPVVLSCARPAG